MVATRTKSGATASLPQSFYAAKATSTSSAPKGNAKRTPAKRKSGDHNVSRDGGLSQSKVASSPKSKALKAKPVEAPSAPLPILSEREIHLRTTIAVPPLPFSLSEGKRHLVDADPRFAPLLARIPLRVFEEFRGGKESADAVGDPDGSADSHPIGDETIKDLNLFRTLVTSILGQQVSWLAARAILYKFTRLWFPELPVFPDFKSRPRESLPFPTPLQVRSSTEAQLRSAGLSGQKVRYVTDIAERFSDGRLDVRKIMQMSEAECVEELVKIKGVGVWTAQMLLIFALRRPDVLPCADLGVQKGVILLWCSDAEGPVISSAKAKPLSEVQGRPNKKIDDEEEEEVRQDLEEVHRVEEAAEEGEQDATIVCADNVVQRLRQQEKNQKADIKLSPDDLASHSRRSLPTIPPAANLTPSQLTARKNGTKTKGNVYLSPSEIEALAESWKPYRSLASVIMWALVDS